MDAYSPGRAASASEWWGKLGKRARNELASICWLAEGTERMPYADMPQAEQGKLEKRFRFCKAVRPVICT